MYIDTHCHLDDRSLRNRLSEVLRRASVSGVEGFVIPGVTPALWPDIAALAREREEILPAFGVHPLHAGVFSREVAARLADFLPDAVAVGEIGLDYSVPDPPRQIQQAVFREQLAMAVDFKLPVLIHCRQAFEDLLRIMRGDGVRPVGGIMHAYSGSVEVARECLKLGLLISVSGTVTYANAVRLPEVVRQIPLANLVLETDSPDMTPEPYRGQTNEPGFIHAIAEKVAALKGVTLAETAATTTRNAVSMFDRERNWNRGRYSGPRIR